MLMVPLQGLQIFPLPFLSLFAPSPMPLPPFLLFTAFSSSEFVSWLFLFLFPRGPSPSQGHLLSGSGPRQHLPLCSSCHRHPPLRASRCWGVLSWSPAVRSARLPLLRGSPKLWFTTFTPCFSYSPPRLPNKPFQIFL